MALLRDDASYMIVNIGSLTALTPNGGGQDPFACVGNALAMQPQEKRQVWRVKFTNKDSTGKQFFQLTNIANGKKLDLRDGKTDDNNPVQEWAANGTDSQEWYAAEIHGNAFPVYTIYTKVGSVNAGNGHCLDLVWGNKNNGSKIAIWDASNIGTNDHQVWVLVGVNPY